MGGGGITASDSTPSRICFIYRGTPEVNAGSSGVAIPLPREWIVIGGSSTTSEKKEKKNVNIRTNTIPYEFRISNFEKKKKKPNN